jgi:hypothetical protein
MNLDHRILAALSGIWLAAPLACTQVAGLDASYTSAIDAPCQSSADCASGVCTGSPGWCSLPCSGDADCPEGYCVENTNKVNACFPACSFNADCGAYGVSGLTCQPTTTVDGVATSICST